MTRIDVTDTAVIDAPPEEAYAAVVSLAQGGEQWWLPDVEVRPVGELPVEIVGGVIEITVHRPLAPRLFARYTDVRENELLIEEFFGEVRGQGTWSFEPEGPGCRISFRWEVELQRRLHRWFPGVAQRMHSKVTQAGFRHLQEHLAQNRGDAPRRATSA